MRFKAIDSIDISGKNLDLSIIIINWNSSAYLERCLESIVDNIQGLVYEMIVVDNASYDGCDRMVGKYTGVATLIQSDRNLGFARANNLGYHNSRGRVLLFLNPDTEILSDAVNQLYGICLSRQNMGALGCRVLNTDGSVQTSCVQSFPTIINQLLDAEFVRNRFPKSRLWGMKPLFLAHDQAVEAEAITGACLMVRRDIFEKAGLFSEEYFMFAEDLDLCYKIRQLGYRNYYFGGTSVVHHGGGSTKSTNVSSFSAVLIRESVKKFLGKFHGSTYSFFYVLAMQLLSIIRILMLLIIYPVSLLNIAQRGTLDRALNKWKSIFRWSIGMEKWAEKT